LRSEFLIPPGFKDHVSFDAYVEHEYKNNIIKFFRSNGFDLVKTPLIDFVDSSNYNNFLIANKKNEESLKIRNDITPQIIRIASSRLLNKSRPLKLCYYGEVVRKNGTMLRPERQFLQVGAETIGSNRIEADIEVINLAYQSLSKIGIKEITLEFSSKIFLRKFFKKINQSKLEKKLTELIKIKDLNNCLKLLKNEKDKNLLINIFKCTGELKTIKKFLDKLKVDEETETEVKNLKKLVSKIELSKLDRINIDLSELDEKKYHDGLKFTFFSKNVRGEVASGGRYTIKNKNNTETATGFTCFMDTVLRASSFENIAKKILLPFNTDKKMKNNLIKKGFVLFSIFQETSDIKRDAKKFNCNYFLKNNLIKKI